MAQMEVRNETEPTQETSLQRQGEHRQLPGMLEVNVTSAAEVDSALEQAIAAITETARHHSTGILVTRIGVGSYIIRAHPGVPYGLIRQQQE